MNLHEQARAEAEKRYLVLEPARQARKPFIDGYLAGHLAGHEAATRTRVVTTVTELDALPIGSVVLSEQGAVFERLNEAHWSETGFTWKPQSEDITLPARVLYDPEEDR